jgi:hypothetical protein
MNSRSAMKSLTRVCAIAGLAWRHVAVVALCLALTACSGGGGGGDGNSANLSSVGGFITGLNGTIALRNNSGSIREFSNDDPSRSTPFALPPRLTSGQTYNVVIVSQPQGQVCTVVKGSGVFRGSQITDIRVNCVNEGQEGDPNLTLTPRSAKIFRFTWDAVPGATEYHLHEKPDAASEYEPIASFGPDDPNEYEIEVFLPARIGASYILEYCDADGCEDSAPVQVSGTLAEAIGYVKASNTGANDQFGYSIALSADGGTLAVGAPFEDSDATGVGNVLNNGGAVYVYTRTAPGSWEFQTMLKATDAGAGDQFGYSIALSADGNVLATGAPFEDSDATAVGEGLADSGAVYVYTRTAQAWTEQQKLKASNADSDDWFGWSLALSADGTRLAVGAMREDGNGADELDDSVGNSGAVYVFQHDQGNGWSQQAYVKASTPGSNDEFGRAVALSADGSTLAVGAPQESGSAFGVGGAHDDAAPNSGAVYVYRFNGGAWGAPVYVKATNTDSADWFGYSLALSADGSMLAVGAWAEDSAAQGINGNQTNNDAPGSGAVYVYVRDSLGQWSFDAYLKASNPQGSVDGNPDLGDVFGYAVALADDGNILAVGAYSEDSNATGIGGNQLNDGASNSGAVYVFRRTNGEWIQQAYVKAPNTGAGDVFGDNLALSGDGSVLAVGAPLEDGGSTGVGGPMNNAVTDSGAVYLY